jgi:DNA-directed RNA polymerase specialized sigma24 family protein
MPRRFFEVVDPSKLDQYTDRRREGIGRRKPAAVVRSLDLFRRSLQCLPYRELQMLFHKQVLRVDQDDIATLFLVRQSNISYRLQRAEERLKLRHEIQSVASETTLRNALLDAETPPRIVDIVLGVLKTFSQKLAAAGLGLTQATVRNAFDKTLKRIAAYQPPTPRQEAERQALLRMMCLVNSHWNQLHEIDPQSRYSWKRGKKPKPTQAAPKKWAPGPASLPSSQRRRGEFRYAWVQKRTGEGVYRASANYAGRRLSVHQSRNIHEAALAVNLANRLLNGPNTPDVNVIAPENMPDEQDRADIERKVRQFLTQRGLIRRQG